MKLTLINTGPNNSAGCYVDAQGRTICTVAEKTASIDRVDGKEDGTIQSTRQRLETGHNNSKGNQT